MPDETIINAPDNLHIADYSQKPAPEIDEATGEIKQTMGGMASPWAKGRAATDAARMALNGGNAPAISGDMATPNGQAKVPVLNSAGNPWNKNAPVIMGRDGEGENRAGVTLMEVLSFIQDSPYTEFDRVAEQMLLRKRGLEETINTFRSAAVRLGLDRIDSSLNRFTEGMQWADQLTTPDDLPVIWFGMYDGALNLFNGQAKAGKSSVWYNIAMHLTAGKELWGIPVQRQEKIFYIDPENRVARPHRLARISEHMEVPFMADRLCFHDGEGINLSDPRTIKELGDLLLEHKFTGLVIDPWVNLFETTNENDNAEAARQGKALLDLIKRCGIWATAIHHTGRSGEGGARGASAREGIARVIWDLVLPEEVKDKDDEYVAGGQPKMREDAVRLHVRRDGIGGLQNSIYLKMLGSQAQDCFERITYKDYAAASREGGAKGESIIDKCVRALTDYFMFRDEVIERQVIITDMKEAGFGLPSISSALEVMTGNGGEDGGLPMLKKQKISGRGGNAPFGYFRSDFDPNTIPDPTTGATPADDEPRITDFSATAKGVRKTTGKSASAVSSPNKPLPGTEDNGLEDDDLEDNDSAEAADMDTGDE